MFYLILLKICNYQDNLDITKNNSSYIRIRADLCGTFLGRPRPLFCPIGI